MGSGTSRVLNSGLVRSGNGSGNGESDTRRFGLFELDLRAGELRRSGVKVKLQEQPFQILALLLEKPGEVVTRDDLRNRLWPADTFVDFDHSLNAAIKRLRDALGDSAENPTFVETVARRGYRFLAPVTTPANEAQVSAAPESGTAETPVRDPAPFHFWWLAGAAGALILLLLGIKLGLSLAQRHTTVQTPRIWQLTANPADDRVRAAAISRDGRYLAFFDETGFYLRQIDTGETHPVVLPQGFNVQSVSWFPDSTHMVVASFAGAQSSLWEISTLGGNARKLSDDGSTPAVSPDGRAIAYITGRWSSEELWLMAADGAQPRKLVGEQGDSFGPLAWSPDGARIAYTRGKVSYQFDIPGAIELVDVQTHQVTSLLQVSSLMHWFSNLEGPLAWLADGRLVYTLAEQPPRQLDSNLWSIGVDSSGRQVGAPVRLTSDSGTVLGISASADGKRLAYLKGVPQPDVYVAKLNGRDTISEPVRLTLDDRQDIPFDWTPDGKAVLFISDRTGTFSIYRQAIDQTQPELLVANSRSMLCPRLSPDGTQLLYLTYPSWTDNSSTAVNLMRVPLAGGAPQRVLAVDLITNQQCARAGGTVCLYSVVTRREFTLFRFDPLNGNATQVYQVKDEVPYLYNWSLSPDGGTLALAKAKWGNGTSMIRLVSLKTGAEKLLEIRGSTGVATLDWAADGKSLWAASAGDENMLLNIDLQGNARSVWRPKKKSVYWAIPSRDGKYLAIHVGSGSANVWMLEHQ